METFLSKSQILVLKTYIDTHPILNHVWFGTVTWNNKRLKQLNIKLPFNKHSSKRSKRLLTKDFNDYKIDLCRENKCHAEFYWALTYEWEHPNIHFIAMTDKPLFVNRPTRVQQRKNPKWIQNGAIELWKFGQQVDFRPYDAQWKGGNPTDGAVSYIFKKHVAHWDNEPVYHPNFRSCRNGNCKTCQKLKNKLKVRDFIESMTTKSNVVGVKGLSLHDQLTTMVK